MQETRAVRRRRRRASKRNSASWGAYFRGRQFSQIVFGGMCVLGTIYVAKHIWDVRMDGMAYSSVGIDVPEVEVRYALGSPTSIEDGGRTYRYANSGRTILAHLSEQGHVTSVTCAIQPGHASQCDPFLHTAPGDDEGEVLLALGRPSRVTYSGNDKVMHYDGIGLDLWLEKLRVHQIGLRQGGNSMGYVSEAIWRMIP